MFWHWFYHSFAGWLLRIQLVLLRSFFIFFVRIFYRLTRKTVQSISAPSSKKIRSQEQERQRLAGCRTVVLEFAQLFGTIAREAISRAELEKLIDNGISPEDLRATIYGRMRDAPGLMLGEIPAGGEDIPIKLPDSLRDRHCYIIGRSGSGKTNIIRLMLQQDICFGNGVGVLAPEQELITDEGHVTDVHFTVSHRQPKLIAIDKQPNDDVMYLDRSGKADRLAG
jgi:DNA helicase HerA-like ATPase